MERKPTQLSHLARAQRREFLAKEAKHMKVETVARRNGVTLKTVIDACAIYGVTPKFSKKK